jgi:hypothetical protein
MKTIFALAFGLVLALGSGANAQLYEDFNSGTFPGSWSVVDLLLASSGGTNSSDVVGWDLNTNIVDLGFVRGNFTTGDVGAAHIDSDAFGAGAGAYNMALVSPTFNVNAGDTLQFFHQFRSLDSGDFIHVEASTDGSAWTGIYTSADDVGTNPDFPMTAYTAGGIMESLSLAGFESATSQVRFRYEGDSWDWWWQVDNVSTVSSVPEPASSAFIGLMGLAWFSRRTRSARP